jgi:hypothetical protein
MITEQPGIKAKPIGDTDKDIMETLLYYDDELCDEKSCFLIQEKLENHFISAPDDVHVQVSYDKEDERVIIGITIFFNTKEDRTRLFDYRDEFETFYKETFSRTKNSRSKTA